jgi:hypothetical protein
MSGRGHGRFLNGLAWAISWLHYLIIIPTLNHVRRPMALVLSRPNLGTSGIIYEVRKADQRNGFRITDIVKDGMLSCLLSSISLTWSHDTRWRSSNSPCRTPKMPD